MAKLVRHLTSNEEIVSSNLAEGNFFLFLVHQFNDTKSFTITVKILYDYLQIIHHLKGIDNMSFLVHSIIYFYSLFYLSKSSLVRFFQS
ncbi:uncharacterized protein PRCAT00004433001 [Priceomyces carsonii]|uniref:uncharacterized protein n=1 Tax=Priceomyces carsonii TaxID=28549 RepID=UPI002ED7AAFC|nr:unnamed protein product [Priceomyces carsonii]